MPAAFPLTPVPGYIAHASFASPAHNFGVFYVGDTVTFTLSQATPNAYYVLNYNGVQVSSGSISGTTCSPTAPGGGWLPGWYRVYFTGTNTDTLYGPSYGATAFCVLRVNSNFIQISASPALGNGAFANVNDPPAVSAKAVVMNLQSRLQIGNAASLASGTDQLVAQCEKNANAFSGWWSNNGFTDPHRARPLFVQFPNGAVNDTFNIPATTGTFLAWLWGYPATPALNAAGNNLYLSFATGSSSGVKVTVYYPNNTTVVETWDNLSNTASTAAATINAGSAYIRVFVPSSGGGPTPNPPMAVTALGTGDYSGVVTTVSTLYPTVQYYEGPRNEPTMNAENAHAHMLFQGAVHDGNASAKAMGPCFVDNLTLTGTNSWTTYLAAIQAEGFTPDVISQHAYNGINGDMNYAHNVWTAFNNLLATYGYGSIPQWATEGGTSAQTAVYGVHHPRRSRWAILGSLLLEQYGIPREQNIQWYDFSHGFWSVPQFLVTSGDTSLAPTGPLYHVLAEETFGMTHNSKLNFGNPGNNIFLGSIYTTPGGGASCAAIICASYMPTCSVTLLVTGVASTLTVVDAFGNTSTVPVTAGVATVNCAEIPTYVRLPSGVSVSVVTINGWLPQQTNHALSATATLGGVSQPILNDGAFMTDYVGGTSSPGIAYSTGTLPGDTAVLTWTNPVTVDRVVAFCGAPWQQISALTDFDVQTTIDGTTWVTQQTVTKTNVTSFQHGTDSSNLGCEQETYWDEQGIFDVPFTAPVTNVLGVRLYVRSTSFGGEPDSAANTATSQGGLQRVVLQELMALQGSLAVTVHKPQGRASQHI